MNKTVLRLQSEIERLKTINQELVELANRRRIYMQLYKENEELKAKIRRYAIK